MGRVFKEVDYLNLVVMIYKLSKLNEKNIILLYNYTCNYLNDNHITKEYLIKLQCDLNMNKPPTIQYRSLERKLDSILTAEEKTRFKVELFNTLQKSYYS